jgi:hypothetical protein
MGFTNLQQQHEATEAARTQQAKRDCIAHVYATYPTMVRCEANERAIIETILAWTQNPDVLPTIELFQSMLDENPEAIKTLATQPVERHKEQIIQEILTLLASKNDGRDGKFDSHNLRSEEARMKSWSLDALRTRLNEIKIKQGMSAQPVAALKAFVQEAHADRRPFPGWPTLPPQLVLPGQIYAINVTAEWLNGLARNDIWQFKRVVKLYGSQQVDARRGIK